MTLRSRNVFVRLSLVFVTAGITLFSWFVARPVMTSLVRDHPWASLAVVLASTIPLLGSIVLAVLFRRTMSSPVFFVTSALAAAACTLVRLAIPGVQVSFLESIVAMRIVIASHLTFALLLFAAGLHAAEQAYRRHAWVLFAVLFVALTLSWTIPVDAFSLRRNLTHPVALGDSMGILVGVFLVLATISYLQVGVRERDRRAVVSGASMVFMAAGYELLYYAYDPIAIAAGVISTVIGVATFAQQSYRDQIIE